MRLHLKNKRKSYEKSMYLNESGKNPMLFSYKFIHEPDDALHRYLMSIETDAVRKTRKHNERRDGQRCTAMRGHRDATKTTFQWHSQATVAIASTVQIECASESIIVHISTEGKTDFHGLVYPRGLSKNSSCLQEYRSQPTPITYNLPLRSCNTMPTELDDGGIEYFNTIVVQPHLKLVTNQGRGFHVRCRYQTRDKVVTNDHTHVAMLQSLPLQATAPMPGCTMKIFSGDPTRHQVAENVKIGDPLTLVISIDKQEMFGLKISDCLVRDGLGWGEQRLINDEGCPVDGEIMGQFTYNEDKTEAKVNFQAHKFPYTASVYYQCNVRLCVKHGGGCSNTIRRVESHEESFGEFPKVIINILLLQPPACNLVSRRRRDTANDNTVKGVEGLDGGTPATIEVYSGLYVNEASDIGSKSDFTDDVFRERTIDDPNSICISQRSFAIGIAIAGLILMLAVVAAILVLLAKRRHKSVSTTGSSIYSGPYTNTAYSHSS
ncbi:Cuticlin-1 [Eufriesea mexicana]|uniref:Cuticlin-1 n=1 Tax=Eufriesea mexicana TaxID=516756 RepID=A0A310S839_9HYME|nr:Cuticlin-1 [Eufriesea mexicana]